MSRIIRNTHKQNVVLLIVKVGGTYSYHSTLKDNKSNVHL
jgi:hypothetical protein